MMNRNGQLELEFTKNRDGRTILSRQYYRMPLQIMKPHYYDEGKTPGVYILNPGGGVLQYDRLRTSITCKGCASAIVTTPSANKFYRMDEDHAELYTEIWVEKGSVLEYLPEHNVPYAGSRVKQTSRYHVEKGAVLFASDMVTAGRVGSGEAFLYDEFSSKTEIYEDGRLIMLDSCRLEPSKEELQEKGLLDGDLSNGTIYVYAPGIDPGLKDEINREEYNVRLAAGFLTPELMVVRSTGNSMIDMKDAMLKAWGICRRSILGRPPVRIRKY